LQKRAKWIVDEMGIKKHLKKADIIFDVGTGRGHVVERVLIEMEKEGKPLEAKPF